MLPIYSFPNFEIAHWPTNSSLLTTFANNNDDMFNIVLSTTSITVITTCCKCSMKCLQCINTELHKQNKLYSITTNTIQQSTYQQHCPDVYNKLILFFFSLIFLPACCVDLENEQVSPFLLPLLSVQIL